MSNIELELHRQRFEGAIDSLFANIEAPPEDYTILRARVIGLMGPYRTALLSTANSATTEKREALEATAGDLESNVLFLIAKVLAYRRTKGLES